MRRLTAWVGGIASGIVAYRFWRRHHGDEAGAQPEAAAEADARAEELRAKLAESRAVVEEEPTVEEPPAEPAEPRAEEPSSEPAEQESIEDRRRRVHEEGRATIDEMHSE